MSLTSQTAKQDKNIDTKKLKDFGLLFTGVFILLAAFQLYHKKTFAIYFIALACITKFLSYFFPSALYWPEKLWMKFGDFMSSIMTRVMVFLIFALAVTPIALIMRVLGKRPLKLSFDKNLDSYWEKFDEAGPSSRPYLPY